jgi:hypothetical protein
MIATTNQPANQPANHQSSALYQYPVVAVIPRVDIAVLVAFCGTALFPSFFLTFY